MITDSFSNMKPIGWYGVAGHRFYTPDWVDSETGIKGWHCDECEAYAKKEDL